MLIIKDEHDLTMLKQRTDIEEAVIGYIEQYFHRFSKEVGEKTSRGISIENCGVIVLLQKTDHDLSNLVFLPNILNSIPEQVDEISIQAGSGKQRTLLHGLFLSNNEFGIDLIAIKDELTPDMKHKFESELN